VNGGNLLTGGNQANSSSEAPENIEAAQVHAPHVVDPLATYTVHDFADRYDANENQAAALTADQRIAAETEAARRALGMPPPAADRLVTTPRMTPMDVLVPLILGQPLALVKFLPTRVLPFRSSVPISRVLMSILAGEIFLCAVVVSAGVAGARGLNVILVFVAAMLVDFIARAGLLIFIYRAYSNLLSFRAAGLMSTPAMAVACWFLPVVSFFRPYQAVQEIWRASDPRIRFDIHHPADWYASPSSPLVASWWLSMFLFIPIIGLLIFMDVDLMGGSYYATMSVGFIVNALLTLFMVDGIARRQEAKFATMSDVASQGQ